MTEEQVARVTDAARAIDADVLLFNSEIKQHRDFEVINAIAEGSSRPNALLILTTMGGDPDCAYRIGRYLQTRYDHLTVLVAGRCKSAGTLIAMAATELAFMPFGELGPLDIQLSKVDKFDRAESGLTIQDALNTLEARATASFYQIASDYIAANNGMMSFPTASKSAADFVTQLYAPVFGRIDPEEVGAKTRSMRIAQDYGERLAIKWGNPMPEAAKTLAESYSSHSFVIDMREAKTMFNRVRAATDEEKALVAALGGFARFQVPGDKFEIRMLSERVTEGDVHANDDDGGDAQDGAGPQGAGEPPGAEAENVGQERIEAAE